MYSLQHWENYIHHMSYTHVFHYANVEYTHYTHLKKHHIDCYNNVYNYQQCHYLQQIFLTKMVELLWLTQHPAIGKLRLSCTTSKRQKSIIMMQIMNTTK